MITLPAPTILQADTITIDCGEVARLSASVGEEGTGEEIWWFLTAEGGESLGETVPGNEWVAFTQTSRTYYAAAVSDGGNCLSAARDSIYVNVTNSNAPIVSADTVYCGATATFRVSNPREGYNYAWYSDAACTNLVGEGLEFTTPALTSDTTFYVTSGYDLSFTQDYTYTGTTESLQIPYGLDSVTIELWGAQGGSAGGTNAPGGKGAYVKGTLNVSGAPVLYINVGGQGSVGSSTSSLNGGGYNGGGDAGYHGGGGGGATDIRFNNRALNYRVMVAGGGGGAYYYNTTYKAAGVQQAAWVARVTAHTTVMRPTRAKERRSHQAAQAVRAATTA